MSNALFHQLNHYSHSVRHLISILIQWFLCINQKIYILIHLAIHLIFRSAYLFLLFDQISLEGLFLNHRLYLRDFLFLFLFLFFRFLLKLIHLFSDLLILGNSFSIRWLLQNLVSPFCILFLSLYVLNACCLASIRISILTKLLLHDFSNFTDTHPLI